MTWERDHFKVQGLLEGRGLESEQHSREQGRKLIFTRSTEKAEPPNIPGSEQRGGR